MAKPIRRTVSARQKAARHKTQRKRVVQSLTYANSGVSIEAGDESTQRIFGHLRRTYGPRVLGRDGAFAGMLRLDYNERLFQRNYRDPVLVACADGVGTKVLIATEMGKLETIGIDCVAMNVNDLIVQGAEPVMFLDYLGVHKVVPDQIEALVKGVADGCQQAGCALLGGETAEMPDVYRQGDLDLAGFSVGVVELSRAVTNDRAEPGDIVLGLGSAGIHSNGYSLVRAILKKARLKLDKRYPEALGPHDPPGATLGEILLTPTRIYARPIVEALHAYRVKRPIVGMAHITGGGLEGNLNRALPKDVDAHIDPKSWDVHPIFRFLQKRGNVAEAEMRKTFNLGVGYVLVVRPYFAEAVAQRLIRRGERVFVLGEVRPGTGVVKFKKARR
ncbi:MAG: phosphoribosylformylglycinamidine cyclo-ligase [Planctomycetota bacterium]